MSALKPDVDSTHDLGTTTLRWRNLFVDGITVTDNITIAGNLTVEGTTTSIETTNLRVEDPLIKLNRGDTAAPSNDQGFVFSRGDGTNADRANRVLVWDESEDEFVFGVSATEDGTTAGDIAISGYSDVAVGKLVFDSAAGDNIEINAGTSDLTLSATADIALIPGGGDVKLTGHVLPAANNTYDLGSSDPALAWRNIFLQGDITMSDAGTLATGAGALTINGAGGLNLQEGGTSIISISDARAVTLSDLTTLGVTTSGAVDLNSGGVITIDGTSLAIGATSIGAITVDSTSGISLDGAADSNFTLSDGDLSLIADGADNKVVIRGDATHATDPIVAVHIDGDTSTRSVVDIDAGVLDIDASGAATIDAASLSIGATGVGAVSIDSTAGISLDADNASHMKAAAGDLTLEAEANDAKVVIKGDHESGIAIHLDGNAAAASEVQIDAGILDIDVTGAATIDAGTTIGIESSGGTINIGATAVAQPINIGTGNSARTISAGHASSTKLDLKAIDVDVTAGANGFAISGAGASSLTTSAGALTITAAAASTWSTEAGALNITAAAESAWQTEAGALNITGAASSTWQTSGGALTINGAAGLNLQEGGANVIAIDDNKDVLFSHTGGDSADPDVEFDGYVRFDGTVELDSTVQVDGATTLNNTLTVGANTDGHDVKLFGNSDGQYLLWDESRDELVLAGDTKLSFHDDSSSGGENIVASADGHLEINAGTTLDITAPTVEVNAETAVTIQGEGTVTSNSPVSIQDTLTVGENGTGFDVQLFGDTAGKHLLWDQSADELALVGNGTKLSFFDANGGENISADDGGILSVNAGAQLSLTSPIIAATATTRVTLDTPNMVVSSSTTDAPVLELKNTNDDATGPTLKLALDTANSAAANDVAGTIEFFADDAANNNQSYGEIKVVAADITSGSESGKMTLGVATTTDGTVADIVSITGGTSASTSTVQILGNLNVIGTTTTVDQGTMLAANSVTFEGSTQDDHETVLTIADPTADRTITLPDLSGHIPLLAGAVSDSNVTAAEFALLDGGSTVGTTAVADGDGIFTNDGGTMRHTTVETFQTYFDANSVGGSNIVTVGALNAGSIASGFGDINNGASAITTTGLGTFGSLDVDDVVINGTTIGHTNDTDLLTLANAALTLKGTLTVGVDDTGHDVKLFGATSGSYLLWDESADSLLLTDSTPLKIGDAQDMTLYHDGTNSHITNSTGTLNIATVAAGSGGSTAVSIGNATSTVTMGQDLDVTRNLTAAKATVENIDLDDKTITMTGSTDDTASFVVAEHGALSITTVDDAGAAANMTLTADGTFKAIGTTITLDSGGAINLDPAAGSAIVLDGTILVDEGVVTGATSITSTAFVGTLSTAAQPNVTSLGTLTGLGVNGDATFTGAAANMVWDKSDNALEFADSAKLLIGAGDGTSGQGDLELYHDGTDSHIVNRTGVLNINGGSTEIDITTSGALDLNAGATTLDASSLNVTLSSTATLSSTELDIDSTDTTSLTMTANDASVKTLTIDASNSNVGGEGRLSLSADDQVDITDGTLTLTLDGGALSETGMTSMSLSPSGNITLQSTNGLIDIDADNGKLTLDGSGGIDIGVETNVAVVVESSTFSLDAADTITIDSDAGATLGAASFNIDADGGVGSGEIAIDTDDTTNGLKLCASSSGVPVTIGNTVSETTVGDNLTVNGTLDVKNNIVLNSLNGNGSGRSLTVKSANNASDFFKVDADAQTVTIGGALTSSGSQLKIKDNVVQLGEGTPFQDDTGKDIGWFAHLNTNNNSSTSNIFMGYNRSLSGFVLLENVGDPGTGGYTSGGANGKDIDSASRASLECGNITTTGKVTHAVTETTSGAYTVDTDQDDYIIDANHTITLIDATAGRELIVVNTSGGDLTITTSANSDLYIDGNKTDKGGNDNTAAVANNKTLKLIGVGGHWYSV